MQTRTESRPPAVVFDLASMQGLQAARILSRRGVPVIGVARDPHHYCCRTTACERILFAHGAEETLALLTSLGPELPRKAVLFPCQDKHVLLVSRHRRLLEAWYHIVLPDSEVVEMMVDKTRFYRYAQEQGLPLPSTYFLGDRADAEHAARQIDYPCVLKPPHRFGSWLRHTDRKVFKCHDPEELLAHYDRCRSWSDLLIAQTWISGGDDDHYSCNCYFDATSEPLVSFTTRKLRQWPPGTGQGCLSVECRDDEVLRVTLELFRGVGWVGLAYLEMKRDDRSGRTLIVEPNLGRPTGRSASAEAAGVELLYTMYCDALGWPLPANRTQHFRGVKWIHLVRDLQSALFYWRRGELGLRQWWRSLQGVRAYAYFSWRDPWPFLASLALALPGFRAREERRRRRHDTGAAPGTAPPDPFHD